MNLQFQNIVHEPGSIRAVNYHVQRDEHGKYPTTLWGSVEEQLAEATAENLRSTSRTRHCTVDLFTFVDNCEHQNPEFDDRYDGVDDLIDEWLERNCLMSVGWPEWPGSNGWPDSAEHQRYGVQRDLRWKQMKRAEASIPLAAEYERATAEYQDLHNGHVCLASPQGSACVGCLEDLGEHWRIEDSDFGVEPFPCDRQERAKERQAEFWYLVSKERRAPAKN